MEKFGIWVQQDKSNCGHHPETAITLYLKLSLAGGIGFVAIYFWEYLLSKSNIPQRFHTAIQFGWVSGLQIVVVSILFYCAVKALGRRTTLAGTAILLFFGPVNLALWLTYELLKNGQLLNYLREDSVGSTVNNWRPLVMGEPATHDRSETTRYLCAESILKGQPFREEVLSHFRAEGHGAAPEIGLDVDLLVRMCERMERQYRVYSAVFLPLGLVAAVGGGFQQWRVLAVSIAMLTLVHAQKTWSERRLAKEYFARSVYDPERVRRGLLHDNEISESIEIPEEDQNLIVYKDFLPFVGAGSPVDGVTFVVDTSKPKEHAESPKNFEVNDLVSQIRDSVKESALVGLDFRRMYYVQGGDVRTWKELLPDEYGRPVQKVPAEILEKIPENNALNMREYQWATVADWGRELVVSYFLRCSLQGNILFVENDRYLLNSLDGKYRTIDKLTDPSLIAFIKSVVFSIFGGVLSVIGAFAFFGGDAKRAFDRLTGLKQIRFRQKIDRDPFYNYGVRNSLREKFAGTSYIHYFQKKDSQFFQQTLLKVIIDAIVCFLDDHDVDTSELKESRTTILNSGIIVHGGDVKADTLAVGTGAEARSTRTGAMHTTRTNKAKKE